ncbi:hypothetical protein HNO88_003718 [Novosphingobium chloroacetimidivorans]|uniref:Heavy metal-binding domain-containing protein n=1 Tax=Novosphingobium chloroacetimidivorans TaxID=1428314 RepID=A0A7W7NYM2_9SPHN|nr:hypothetical protein [Novosphingobium chloroacetimidivorans]MBB4860375.1 hypothetical protein [Novosphingobium chloroacetimidivorans]
MIRIFFSALAAAAACFAVSLFAAAPVPEGAVVNQDFGVPVFPYDVTDRPYTVLGEVKAGVRKATIFSKAPDQGKVYRELWERAHKLGADAVVKAQYGDPHVTAFSWGSVGATGLAVKFTGPAAATTATVASPSTPAAPVSAAPVEATSSPAQ